MGAGGRTGRRDYRLLVGDPAAVAASIVLAPALSLVAAVRHGLARRTGRGPSRWSDELAAAIRPAHRLAVDPLLDATAVVPDVYVPAAPRADVTVSQHVEQIRELSDAAITSELHTRFGPELPASWARVAEQPHRWRQSWAAASSALWGVLEPHWQQADRQLDREVRRVSLAVARGGTELLLNTLHPGLGFRSGTLGVDAGVSEIHSLSGRRLVLVPMIGPGLDAMVSFDRPDLAYLAYPVRTVEPRGHAGRDELRTVLGDVRSSTLRALARPHTVGELAAELGVAAATMSYHCDSLESAGLVNRSRAGRRVLVSRTFRGAELMELFSG